MEGSRRVAGLRSPTGRARWPPSEQLRRDKRLIGAFGDSASDFPMLAQLRVAVMVRPKPELVHARPQDASARFLELRPAPLEAPLPEPRVP